MTGDTLATFRRPSDDVLATLRRRSGAPESRVENALARGGGLTFSEILWEEVCEAMEEGNAVDLRTELIQVAAVAVAWVERLDRERKP